MAKKKPSNLSKSERNAVENEAVFRKANEKIAKGLEKLEKMAIKDNYTAISSGDLELQFLCECSDPNCTERITMKVKKYIQLHTDRKQFIVMPGHQATEVEKIEEKKNSYTLVKKFKMPSESSTILKMTSVDNS